MKRTRVGRETTREFLKTVVENGFLCLEIKTAKKGKESLFSTSIVN